MRRKLVVAGTALLLAAAGCAPATRKIPRPCPGAESLEQSLSTLARHTESAAAIRASGQCRLQYYIQGRKRVENFPVKLWVSPPNEIYLQGDIAFDPKGVILGSNEHEFWLAIRLKEISSYWWGSWSGQDGLQNLPVSPKVLLEAIGIVRADYGRIWSLSNKGPFDVLTARDEQGRLLKKVYVHTCDYKIRRVEYFDAGGKAMVTAELDKYKAVTEGFSAPSLLKILKKEGEKTNSVVITLDSVRGITLTQKQRDALFNRPQPDGFRQVFMVAGDTVVEQTR